MNFIRRRESVCRSLFGPVDHDQLRRELRLKLKEITEQDARRWNFNFESNAPLPGRFQWEEIPADCAADFYHKSAHGKVAAVTGTDQENCPSISNTHKRPAEVTAVRRKRTHSKAAAKPRNNARITDYFVKRRRMTETKSILNPFHSSSKEEAVGKTIR